MAGGGSARATRRGDTAADAGAGQVASDESLLDVTDDLDDTILAIFLEEANELFPQASEEVRAWRRAPDDPSNAAQLAPHAAHAEGQRADGRRDAPRRARAPDGIATRRSATCRLRRAPSCSKRSTPTSTGSPSCSTRCATARAACRCRGSRSPTQPPRQLRALQPRRPRETAAGAAACARCRLPLRRADRAPRAAAEVETAKAMLRVRADIVDQLVNEAGEVAIARARVEGELRTLKANLLELTGSVIRLRTPGPRNRDAGRDADPVADVARATSRAGRFRSARVRPLHALPGADALVRRRRERRLDRAAGAAEEPRRRRRGADRAGAACRATSSSDCSRSARCRSTACRSASTGSCAKTARELDKRANLEIHGAPDRARPLGAGKAGRTARAPAAQRARPRHRDRATRARSGQVGNRRDRADRSPGRQRNRDRAGRRRRTASTSSASRERARRTRAASAPTPSRPMRSWSSACSIPGFTTASKVTQISGRGIGMDVVRSEIIALGGRVDVHTQPGKGTTVHAVPAADARRRAGGARARRRPHVGAARRRWSSRCSRSSRDVLQTLYVRRRRCTGRVARSRSITCRGCWATTAAIPETGRYNAGAAACAAARERRRSTSTR